MIKTRGISQEEVFEAACKIAAKGTMPTTASLRQILGRGSETTLHKYLQEWKSILLKHAGRIAQSGNLSLLNENKILRQNLEQLTQGIANYSRELQDLELAFAKLKNENSELEQERLQCAALTATLKAQFDSANEQNERNAKEYQETLERIIADKNHIIHSLQEEIRQTQVDAIESMREYSFKEHDLLIHERVKTINLQAEVARLQAIVAKVKDAHLIEVKEESNPVLKNSRAQLLSELYAQKSHSDLQVGDEPDVNNG